MPDLSLRSPRGDLNEASQNREELNVTRAMCIESTRVPVVAPAADFGRPERGSEGGTV